jgi:hypothetical protein
MILRRHELILDWLSDAGCISFWYYWLYPFSTNFNQWRQIASSFASVPQVYMDLPLLIQGEAMTLW